MPLDVNHSPFDNGLSVSLADWGDLVSPGSELYRRYLEARLDAEPR